MRDCKVGLDIDSQLHHLTDGWHCFHSLGFREHADARSISSINPDGRKGDIDNILAAKRESLRDNLIGLMFVTGTKGQAAVKPCIP